MKYLVLVLATLVAGCSTSLSGLGNITEKASAFDGGQIIESSPNWLYGANGELAEDTIKLGAIWNSSAPETISLTMLIDSDATASKVYTGLSGIDVNINGRIRSFKTTDPTQTGKTDFNQVSKTIYTSSSNSVTVPLDYLREMVSAEKCGIRIRKAAGSSDFEFSNDKSKYGQSSARFSIKQLLARIDSR